MYFTGESDCGVTVDLLTSNENYPDNPQERSFVGAFDSRLVYPNDNHEKYGGRFTGIFIPPTSGNWIFYLSSDDAGQLFLNPTGDSPDGAQLIVEEPTCCHAFSASSSSPMLREAPRDIRARTATFRHGKLAGLRTSFLLVDPAALG